MCREVSANGGRKKYRALPADRAPCRRALRPKRAKLAQCRRLRGVVERKLEARWSPQQISAWLASEIPRSSGDAGVPRDHLPVALRPGPWSAAQRAAFVPANRPGHAPGQGLHQGHVGQGQLNDMVMISERPAEVKDRAVPGHWEGDLIFGKRMTSIGTLVERHSRYVMLFKLPNGHGAHAVRKAMAKRILTLPDQLRRRSPGIREKRWPNTSSSPSTPA